ncbi:MAG: InlB B-repeat-containing protein [Erysipelotrichales bacterium]|nr:InlB B-repeat-containing protein [Erysipelotrichales bacterium]
MNKKIFCALGAFILAASLVSCGKGKNSGTQPSTDVSTSVDSPSTNNSTIGSEEEPDVVIPEGMVAVNFRYNYGKNLRFKIVPYYPGDKIEKPSLYDQPQRTGYMFRGWFEDRYCMNAFDFDNTVVPENGLDIYAGWNVFDADPLGDDAIEDLYEEKTYSITYTSGPGFSYINPNGALIKSADAGDVIEFKLAIGRDYEGTPVVTANSQTLTETQGLYSYTVTGNTTFAVSGLTKVGGNDNNDKNLVSWYICGEGSLWGADGWSISGGIQLFENPDNPDDKGQYLGITFAVGDTFKVTDGSTWFGYEKIDTWEDPANAGRSCFEGSPDGFGGQNIRCKVAGTYDMYVNVKGEFWIQVAA